MIRLLTSGESHGKGIVALLEGLPSDIQISAEEINKELARRQKGYGRGGRMEIEKDKVEIISGIRNGKTLGSPITLLINNKDYKNWEKIMNSEKGGEVGINKLIRPRPGHADLPGGIKYGQRDLRNILERASARETTARVAAGAIAKKFLCYFGITIQSHVISLGPISTKFKGKLPKDLNKVADSSPVRMISKTSEKIAMGLIDKAKKIGDTLGGIFEIVIHGVPPGLGSHVQWDRKLDSRFAAGIMSLQAIKGIEIGEGFNNSKLFGSKVHDEISYSNNRGYFHLSNKAGGIEGGMSNGEEIVIRVAKKPISTLKKPLRSINIETKKPVSAAYERSDVCALPAASVIGESICAFVLADAFLEKMGGDFLKEIESRYKLYKKYIRKY